MHGERTRSVMYESSVFYSQAVLQEPGINRVQAASRILSDENMIVEDTLCYRNSVILPLCKRLI
jgi:hypothetical protein